MKKSKTLQKIISKLAKFSFGDGKMMENQVTSAIKALKSRPASESIFALSQYLQELKRIERTHTMYIDTVIPLSLNQIKKIKTIVEKRNRITKVVTQINQKLLGGFKLRVGDEVWDESIVGKITQVKEAITHGRSD